MVSAAWGGCFLALSEWDRRPWLLHCCIARIRTAAEYNAIKRSRRRVPFPVIFPVLLNYYNNTIELVQTALKALHYCILSLFLFVQFICICSVGV